MSNSAPRRRNEWTVSTSRNRIMEDLDALPPRLRHYLNFNCPIMQDPTQCLEALDRGFTEDQIIEAIKTGTSAYFAEDQPQTWSFDYPSDINPLTYRPLSKRKRR